MKRFLALLILSCLLLSGCAVKINENPPPSTEGSGTTAQVTVPSTTPPSTEDTRPLFSDSETDYLFPPYRQSGMLLADVGPLTAGEEVEIRSVESGESAVVLFRGIEYTVPFDAVTATVPLPPQLPEVTRETVGIAADSMGLESETPYLLWTDLWRTVTYLLHREEEGWVCVAALPATVGSLSHPTPKGLYRINYHEMFLGKENAYLCFYTLQFYGDYLYHSVLYDWSGKQELDVRLSSRLSLGCIRHTLADSRLLYETVPDGTAVLIR